MGGGGTHDPKDTLAKQCPLDLGSVIIGKVSIKPLLPQTTGPHSCLLVYTRLNIPKLFLPTLYLQTNVPGKDQKWEQYAVFYPHEACSWHFRETIGLEEEKERQEQRIVWSVSVYIVQSYALELSFYHTAYLKSTLTISIILHRKTEVKELILWPSTLQKEMNS